MKGKKAQRLLLFIFLAGSKCGLLVAQDKISLAGKWAVALDSSQPASTRLPAATVFKQFITLPGTLDDADIGQPVMVNADTMSKAVMRNLWRKHRFTGTAWYRREIQVPKGFQREKMKLLLERVIWKTTVFIDGKEIGTAASLSTPQQFDLPALTPGKHVIILAIDNRQQYNIGDATHAYTDGTQIIWNGVIGKMEISSRRRSIDAVKIFPDVERSKVTLQVLLNDAPKSGSQILVTVTERNKTVSVKKLPVDGNDATILLPLAQPRLWDEFNPNLYQVKVDLLYNNRLEDSYRSAFGLRRLSNEQSLLHINGHPMFLRGTLECNIFPLTGHPPMEKPQWIKLMKTAKSYGLNHLRFHSWCPPEAAFEVADSLGLYLQVELPFWATVTGNEEDATLRYLQNEAALILKTYGNHPSFCFFSMGNELEGNFNWLNNLVANLKKEDDRRLYSTTSFSFGNGSWPQKEDQFYITQWTKKGWVRGQGIFNDKAPRFDEDYRKSIDSLPVPIVTHEIGQYSVYPNMKEIQKYTGVLRPLNFIAVKKDLQKKGLLHQSDNFLMASGKLAASLYKEEMERALKTPGMSGFQLLDLHDFPGQSTALVGLLDAFWDNKGIISAADFSKFCAPVVPLMRFEKAVYTGDEVFSGAVEIANFTGAPLKDAVVQWQVVNAAGSVLHGGEWKTDQIPVGNCNTIGSFQYPLQNISKAQKLTINVRIKNTGHSNEWPIWVYPAVKEAGVTNAHFTTSLQEAMALLEQGKNVVLNPDTTTLKGARGRYPTVFWSPVHFPDPSGTMGLLIKNTSKAFADFPTEYFSSWQWWDMVKNSKSMILDSLPGNIDPLVRVIDNFFNNRSMGTLIEMKAGKGKMILCSMDLHTDIEKRPAAQQLRYSLLTYAGSDAFQPDHKLSYDQIKHLFK